MENRYQGSEGVHPTHALNRKTSTPVWFLDIDGVINSFPKPKAHMVKRYGEYEHTVVLGYSIWHSPKVVDFINAVNASGLVEVVWLTTWRAEARTEFAPAVGLDDFPTITKSLGSDHCWSPDWWKFQGVRDFLQDNGEGRPVVWTDDDLSKPLKRAFREEYPPATTPSLLLTPMTCPGLTPEHLASILAFLRAQKGEG